MFSCNKCKRQFNSKNTLEKHNNKKKTCTSEIITSFDDFLQSYYKFNCIYCKKKFEKQFFLDRHVNSKRTSCYSSRTMTANKEQAIPI